MKKKIYLRILLIILALSLVGCSISTDNTTQSSNSDDSNITQSENVDDYQETEDTSDITEREERMEESTSAEESTTRPLSEEDIKNAEEEEKKLAE